MEFVIVFLAGMIVSSLIIRWAARRTIERVIARLEQDIEKAVVDGPLNVELEFDQNIYFLYNSVDGAFIAQGNDVVELYKRTKQRFPNKTITIVKGDPDIVQRLRDQVREINENSNSVRSTP